MNYCTWRTCIPSRVKEDEEELWPERSSGLNNSLWRFSFFATDQFLERTFMISGNTPRVVSRVDGIVQSNRRTGREEDPFYCLVSPLKGISRKRKNCESKASSVENTLQDKSILGCRIWKQVLREEESENTSEGDLTIRYRPAHVSSEPLIPRSTQGMAFYNDRVWYSFLLLFLSLLLLTFSVL